MQSSLIVQCIIATILFIAIGIAFFQRKRTVRGDTFLLTGLIATTVVLTFFAVGGRAGWIKLDTTFLILASVGSVFSGINLLLFIRGGNLANKLVKRTDYDFLDFLTAMQHNQQSIITALLLVVITVAEASVGQSVIKDHTRLGLEFAKNFLLIYVISNAVTTFLEYKKLEFQTVKIRYARNGRDYFLWWSSGHDIQHLFRTLILQQPQWIVPDRLGAWESKPLNVKRTHSYYALTNGLLSEPLTITVGQNTLHAKPADSLQVPENSSIIFKGQVQEIFRNQINMLAGKTTLEAAPAKR